MVQSQAQQQGKFKATAPTLLRDDSKISARFIEVGEKSFPPLRYCVPLATNSNMAARDWPDEEGGVSRCVLSKYIVVCGDF